METYLSILQGAIQELKIVTKAHGYLVQCPEQNTSKSIYRILFLLLSIIVYKRVEKVQDLVYYRRSTAKRKLMLKILHF